MTKVVALAGIGLGLLLVSAGFETVHRWRASRTVIEGASCMYAEDARLAGSLVVDVDGSHLRISDGNAVFAGAMARDGRFVTTRSHDFVYTDGCLWQAQETLAGTLDGRHLQATHEYVEAVRRGHDCASACRIVSSVEASLR